MAEVGQLQAELAVLYALINQNAGTAGSQEPQGLPDPPGLAGQGAQGGIRGKNPNAKLSDFNSLAKSYQLWLYSLECYLSYKCFNVIEQISAALSHMHEGTTAT